MNHKICLPTAAISFLNSYKKLCSFYNFYNWTSLSKLLRILFCFNDAAINSNFEVLFMAKKPIRSQNIGNNCSFRFFISNTVWSSETITQSLKNHINTSLHRGQIQCRLQLEPLESISKFEVVKKVFPFRKSPCMEAKIYFAALHFFLRVAREMIYLLRSFVTVVLLFLLYLLNQRQSKNLFHHWTLEYQNYHLEWQSSSWSSFLFLIASDLYDFYIKWTCNIANFIAVISKYTNAMNMQRLLICFILYYYTQKCFVCLLPHKTLDFKSFNRHTSHKLKREIMFASTQS